MSNEENQSVVSGQRGFLILAGVVAILSVVLIPGQVILWLLEPPPQTALGFIELLIQRPVMGLIRLDLPIVANYGIVLIIYIALFAVLYHKQPVFCLIGLVIGSTAMAAFFPTNTSVEMLHLSRLYEVASASERIGILAAAEAQLAVMKGTGYTVFYILSGIALITFSVAMLKTDVFSRLSSWAGIAGGIAMLVPSNFGQFGLFMSLVSLIPWSLFGILVGIRFIRISGQAGAVSL
jgi:hypothetical protein